MFNPNLPVRKDGVWLALIALTLIYAAARFLQILSGAVPMVVVVALHVIPPALFALIHGALCYGLRRILVFFAICLTLASAMESMGVLTGFPFGHYYFTGLMGPKLGEVPVLLSFAYVGLAYVSWTLARLILRNLEGPVSGSLLIALPLLASCIMLAWDLSMDPIWGTVLRAWIWQQGGAYFGVPLSNFVGWYLTQYVIYQLFALYLRGHNDSTRRLPAGFWWLLVLLYGICAAGNLLLLIPRNRPEFVFDPVGVQWRLTSILFASASISIFVMGGFASLAWTSIDDRQLPTGKDASHLTRFALDDHAAN